MPAPKWHTHTHTRTHARTQTRITSHLGEYTHKQRHQRSFRPHQPVHLPGIYVETVVVNGSGHVRTFLHTHPGHFMTLLQTPTSLVRAFLTSPDNLSKSLQQVKACCSWTLWSKTKESNVLHQTVEMFRTTELQILYLTWFSALSIWNQKL